MTDYLPDLCIDTMNRIMFKTMEQGEPNYVDKQKLIDAIEAFEMYGSHYACSYTMNEGHKKCDCGYNEKLKELKELI